jgi:hypothetical protein
MPYKNPDRQRAAKAESARRGRSGTRVEPSARLSRASEAGSDQR